MSRFISAQLACALLAVFILSGHAAVTEFETGKIAKAFGSFDVLDVAALKNGAGFVALAASKPGFSFQNTYYQRGFIVLKVSPDMEVQDWNMVSHPTLEGVGLVANDDGKTITVVAHMQGMTLNKQSVCPCAYPDVIPMKDLNPAAFTFDVTSLRCLDVVDINRKERHGETKPNGPGSPVQYCEAHSSVVVADKATRFHVGVSKPGSHCFRGSLLKDPTIWFRVNEVLETPMTVALMATAIEPTQPYRIDELRASALAATKADAAGTKYNAFIGGTLKGQNVLLRATTGTLGALNSSFVTCVEHPTSKIIWSALYSDPKLHQRVEAIFLNDDKLTIVLTGGDRQVFVERRLAADGSLISKFETLPSGSAPHQSAGKVAMKNGVIYVPVLLNVAGAWKPAADLTITARGPTDVAIIKLIVGQDDKISLDASFAAVPKNMYASDMPMRTNVALDDKAEVLFAMTAFDAAGGFGVRVNAGNALSTSKPATIVEGARASKTCPALAPRMTPMADTVPLDPKVVEEVQRRREEESTALLTNSSGSSGFSTWTSFTIVTIVLSVLGFFGYRKLRAVRGSPKPEAYNKVHDHL